MRLDDYASIVIQGCLLLQGLALQFVNSDIQCAWKLALQQDTALL